MVIVVVFVLVIRFKSRYLMMVGGFMIFGCDDMELMKYCRKLGLFGLKFLFLFLR